MTVGHAVNRTAVSTATDPFVPWTRPADWLTLSDPTVGQEKIVILAAVYEGNSNYLAFTISGAYTVDWGDGTAPVNVNAATKTSKQLLWSSYGAGTLTTRGYRQAIITITPQTGQTFTTLSFDVGHSPPPAAAYSTTFLDMVVAGPNVAVMNIGNNGPIQTHRILERFRYVGPNMLLNMTYTFMGLQSLRTLAATNGQGYDLWTSGVVNMLSAFSGCSALEACPVFSSTSLVTNTSSLFSQCACLRSVPLFNTSSVATASSMFGQCSALTSVPAFDFSSLVTAASMFTNDTALVSVPITATPLLSSANNIFNGCTSLPAVPEMDWSKVTTLSSAFNFCVVMTDISALGHATKGITSLCTDMSSAFISCRSLTSLPPINTSGVTNMTQTFNNCSALTTMPTPSGNNWKLTACTTLNSTWWGCTALQTMPMLDTSNVLNFTQCFLSCTALVSVAAWNVASGTSFASMFNGCSSLQSAPLIGARFSISYTGCLLSAAALDAIYTALGTASGSQTITVTFNYGVAGDTPSIATGKGWTVTG